MDTGSGPTSDKVIDIERIMELIPHRYPFLLVDRLIEVNGDVSAIGVKNVTMNEPFFQGHFPGKPVMPGVLIVECMAQTAGALVMETLGSDSADKLVYFMSIDSARFRKPVVPGDTLHVHVERIHSRGRVWKYQGKAKVDGVVVADAVYTAMVADR